MLRVLLVYKHLTNQVTVDLLQWADFLNMNININMKPGYCNWTIGGLLQKNVKYSAAYQHNQVSNRLHKWNNTSLRLLRHTQSKKEKHPTAASSVASQNKNEAEAEVEENSEYWSAACKKSSTIKHFSSSLVLRVLYTVTLTCDKRS